MTRNENQNSIVLLKYKILENYNLTGFSTTIHGGISCDSYHSLNLGVYTKDKVEHIAENFKRLSFTLNNDDKTHFIIPRQIHEDKICLIDGNFLKDSHELQDTKLDGIDAIITNQKNCCIAIATADCAPVLLFDPEYQVLAVIHAGWRGIVKRIVSKTIQQMIHKFHSNPQNILVVIGPAISQEYFEVGDEVLNQFIAAGYDAGVISYRKSTTNKVHISLHDAIIHDSITVGIIKENIEESPFCTYSNSELFFSARRQSINSGRMLTGGILR